MVENDYGSNYVAIDWYRRGNNPLLRDNDGYKIDLRRGGYRPIFSRKDRPIFLGPFSKDKDTSKIPYGIIPPQFGQDSPYNKRMREIDEDIMTRAYEKYPVKKAFDDRIIISMKPFPAKDLNEEKRNKYIEELTAKYSRMCPEYGEYKKAQKEETERFSETYKQPSLRDLIRSGALLC